MALIDGNIVRATVFGSVNNEGMINTFFYRAVINSGTPILEDVANAIIDEVLEPIADLVTAATQWFQMQVLNISNNADVDYVNFLVVGTATGELISPFAAYGLKLNVLQTITRAGGKRIAGVPISACQNGILTLDVDQTQTIENAMGEPIDYSQGGNELTLFPVVVGRLPDGGFDLDRINPVKSATLNRRLTTQNSRKYNLF